MQGITLPSEPRSSNTNRPIIKVISPRDLVIKVESSSNLVDWVTYYFLLNTNGRVQFEAESGDRPRFYRGFLAGCVEQ